MERVALATPSILQTVDAPRRYGADLLGETGHTERLDARDRVLMPERG